ncbi:ubiquinone biosynthesis hydroxylase [uncultured Bartonella sp.]|uniref:ubiquinone biosynthesis hydroxylase n=1 Tax=uncultured Bartonella sp. TaxID=104108 RepID=UPI0025DBA691|nr:ubiquinone biosynthesis hydroxylase [uncultured Bartonella sp.]
MSSSSTPADKVLDLIIAGGAYVGLSLAVAIKQAIPSLKIAVIDAAPKDSWKTDPRASAIAAAAIRMLGKLDCWDEVEPLSQPINDMIVTDSRNSDPVRPVFLTFEGDVAPGEPFAYMVENKYLNGALHRRAKQLGIPLLEAVGVNNFTNNGNEVVIDLSDGKTLRSRLLVAADGARSKLRNIADIKTVYWPYGQMGIVCTVEHERPHNGRAEEHFLPAGPFAILPLKGNRSSLVWNERDKDAKRLMAADDIVFEKELEARFGHHLGALKLVGERRAYPFGLTLARSFVKPRFALAGDAAHGIHPISGQGLNLGFRDVAALAEIIVETARLGLDIGSIVALKRYESWRRFETVRMGITTDVLNRLFSNDISPIRLLRDVGLGVVERMPRLKKYFIQEAAGITNGSPKLLLGEAL